MFKVMNEIKLKETNAGAYGVPIYKDGKIIGWKYIPGKMPSPIIKY